MTPPDLRLIVVTDRDQAAPRDLLDTVGEAVRAGAPAVQLRLKDASARELFEAAEAMRPVVRRHRALLFINDRIDVALAARADGVHLGPEDLPVAAARAAARRAGRPDLLIGASTDRPGKARDLEADGADYIGCGAVFGTRSKNVGDERIGPDGLRAVVEAVAIPVVGIGGVTTANARQVARTGAAGVAAIGAVMTARDIPTAVRLLLEPFGA